MTPLRSHTVRVAAWAMVLAATAHAGPSLDGAATLGPGERATYRLSVAGDSSRAVCDVELTMRLPAGFRVGAAHPSLAALDGPSGQLSYVPIERLDAGGHLDWDLALVAPPDPTEGELCGRVRYVPCDGGVVLLSDEICRPLNVSGAANGVDAIRSSPQPTPPTLALPCAHRTPLLDGIVTAAEYPQASIVSGTRGTGPEGIVVYVYHDPDYLYIGFDVDDASYDPQDTVHVVVDVNQNGLDPDAPDRQYVVPRGGVTRAMAGVGTNSDGLLWQILAGSVATMERRERPGGWTAELALPFAGVSPIDLAVTGQGEVVGVAFLDYSSESGGMWATYPAGATLEAASTWAAATLVGCAPDPIISVVSDCAGRDMLFSVGSTVAASTHLWDFGDGTPPAMGTANEVHAFAVGGTYTVTLTACNPSGCTVASETVEVWERPLPVVVASPQASCVGVDTGASVALDASASTPGSGATITGYAWTTTLGDPLTGTGPTEVLTVPPGVTGAGLVSVEVTDNRGCAASQAVAVAIDPAPSVSIGVVPAAVGSATRFEAAPIGGTPPHDYLWDFGDGGTAVGATVRHVYRRAGDYVVAVTLTDQAVCSALASEDVTIVSRLVGGLSVGSACLGEPVELVASIYGGTPPHRFDWRFGDGAEQHGTEATVSHLYSSAARHPVDLVVTDSAGQSVELAATASVRARPELAATVSGDRLVGALVSFETESQAGVAYDWTFSDGAVLAGASVARVFTEPGPTWADVTATDAAGCAATESVVFEVLPGVAELSFSKVVEPYVVSPGGVVEYGLRLTAGAGTLRQTTIDDWLPDGFRYLPGSVSQDGAATIEPSGSQQLSFAPFDLDPFASTTIRYRVRIADGVPAGLHDNRARVRVSSVDGQARTVGPRVATVRVVRTLPADLVVTKSVSGPTPTVPGSTLTYTLTWNNRGDGPAASAVIADDYDETMLEIVTLGGDGEDDGASILFQLGDLEPGAAGVLTYTARVFDEAAGAIVNTAHISSTAKDSNPADNSASASVTLAIVPAELDMTVSFELLPECAAAHVVRAVRGDRFLVGPAMETAAAMLDAAGRLESGAVGPVVDGLVLPELTARLRAIARANIETLFLRSGAGLRTMASAAADGVTTPAIAVPFAEAHAFAAAGTGPLCGHDEHRWTRADVVGSGFGAIAAYAGDAARPGADASSRGHAPRLLALAGEAVGWLASQRAAAPLAQRVVLTPAGMSSPGSELAHVTPASPDDLAVLLAGLGRLVVIAGVDGVGAPDGLADDATALLVRVAGDLAAAPRVTVRGAAAIERLLVTVVDAPALTVPSELQALADASLPSPAPGATLNITAARLRRALHRGDDATARSIYLALESGSVVPRLGLYVTGPDRGRLDYDVTTFGALIDALSRLASTDRDGARALERLRRLVDGVGVAAGLQAGGLAPVAAIAGGSRHASPVHARRPGEAAVLVDHVTIAATAGTVASATTTAADCRDVTARVEPRFATAAGLGLVDALDVVGAALEGGGCSAGDGQRCALGAQLQARASAHDRAIRLHSGLGIRLRHGDAVATRAAEHAILARSAAVAGLERPPRSVLPIWLPLDGGEVSFPQVVDGRSRYGIGWDPARFEPRVGLDSVAEALLADVRLARALTGEAIARERFTGLVALHQAAQTVAWLRRQIDLAPPPAGWRAFLDAEGRPVELRAEQKPAGARAVARLLEALDRLNVLMSRPGVRQLASEAGVPELASLTPLSASLASALVGATDDGPDDGLSPLALSGRALETAARAGVSQRELGAMVSAIVERFVDRGLIRSGREESARRRRVEAVDMANLLHGLAAALPSLDEAAAGAASGLVAQAYGVLRASGLDGAVRARIATAAGPVEIDMPRLGGAVELRVIDVDLDQSALYPGDRVRLEVTVTNGAQASIADGVSIALDLGSGLRPLDVGPDGQSTDRLLLDVGRLEGGASASVVATVWVAAGAAPGRHPITLRARGHASAAPSAPAIASEANTGSVEIGGFGSISGRVVLDVDRDGRLTAAEPGVPDVVVELSGGRSALTDLDGRFVVERLRPGTWVARLRDDALPGSFLASGPGRARIAVAAGSTAEIDMAVRSADVVTGLVYRDDNGDGRRDRDEPTVARAVVETAEGQRSITDRSGRYVIRGVPTGTHRIGIARAQPWLDDDVDLRIVPAPLSAEPERADRGGRAGHRRGS